MCVCFLIQFCFWVFLFGPHLCTLILFFMCVSSWCLLIQIFSWVLFSCVCVFLKLTDWCCFCGYWLWFMGYFVLLNLIVGFCWLQKIGNFGWSVHTASAAARWEQPWFCGWSCVPFLRRFSEASQWFNCNFVIVISLCLFYICIVCVWTLLAVCCILILLICL